jgi:hypothetical protein
MLVLYGILANSASVGVVLGSALAAVDNIEFIVLLVIATTALRKFDIAFVSIVASVVRGLILVSATRSFQAELGIVSQTYWQVILSSFVAFVAILSCLAILFTSFKILRYGETK